MNYTRQIFLDVNATSAVTVVKAKQGDDSLRFINVTLVKDGVQVVPDNGATATFRLEKPDGHAVVNTATINQNGSVTITLTAQCTAVPGRCKADVMIKENDLTISTALFILEVVASPDVANQATSSDEFTALSEAIAWAETVINQGVTHVADMTLSATWSGSSSPYYQTVVVPGYTATVNTRVDLVCDAANIQKLTNSGTGRIYIVNNNGTLTAYATNNKPTVNIAVQAIASEEYSN